MELGQAWMYFLVLMTFNISITIMAGVFGLELIQSSNQSNCYVPDSLNNQIDSNVQNWNNVDANAYIVPADCVSTPDSTTFSALANSVQGTPGWTTFFDYAALFLKLMPLALFGLTFILINMNAPAWLIWIFFIPNMLIVVVGGIQIGGYIITIIKRVFSL